MPHLHTEWTADMLDDLPDDGNRYEVIDGELFVTPAPLIIHQFAVGELYARLMPYAKSVGIDVLFAPSAVRFSNRREVQPDVFAMPRLADGRRAEKFTDVRVLLLAVEVLSPSTMRTDRFKKRSVYQQENVADYWIVDTASRTIEHWTPNDDEPQYHAETIIWQPVPDRDALTIDLVQYFREVLGESVPA
ncbi:MAG: Uma2 family endonuclease [Gemmatimonas sp.]